MFEWLYFKNEDNILVEAAPEHSKQMTSLLIMRTGGAAASTLAFLPENGGGFPPHPLPAWSSTLERFPVHPTWDSGVRAAAADNTMAPTSPKMATSLRQGTARSAAVIHAGIK